MTVAIKPIFSKYKPTFNTDSMELACTVDGQWYAHAQNDVTLGIPKSSYMDTDSPLQWKCEIPGFREELVAFSAEVQISEICKLNPPSKVSNVPQCSVLTGSTEYFIYIAVMRSTTVWDDVTRSVFLSEFTCGTGMEVPKRPVVDRGWGTSNFAGA